MFKELKEPQVIKELKGFKELKGLIQEPKGLKVLKVP